MNINQENLAEALKKLNDNYPDLDENNKRSTGSSNVQTITDERYEKIGMKRSRFQNVIYSNCVFKNTAFSASSFQNTTFQNTELSGTSLSCCNFFDCHFLNDTLTDNIYSGNNLSQSNFTACEFYKVQFKSSGFLQSLFYNCNFFEVIFQSSTLEGSSFNGCCFEKVNAGHTSIEFIELSNATLKSVIFPFYQFAYVIGASDLLKKYPKEISFLAGDKEVTCSEYLCQRSNLIFYYLDKQEYFPACNLLITQGDIEEAQSVFLNGINSALETLDFRMIRYFCRLAKKHDLLDEITIHRARKKIEHFLYSDTIPPERLNDYIVNAGEIRQLLVSGKSDSITYNFNIRTNINKTDKAGIEYINALTNELNSTLAQYDSGQLGFQVAVSHHSPFEIAIDVICAAGALATIAQLIWSIVESKQSNSKSREYSTINEYSPVDQTLYAKYIDSRIERCKEQLLNLKSKYSERKLNKYIEEITQQLKTDIMELYSKDIMIFKKNNTEDT